MRAKIFLPLLLTAALVNAAQFKFGNQTFTVPDGFTVERVAGPDLVKRPIEASFDEQGRLYVTDSSGSNTNGFTCGACSFSAARKLSGVWSMTSKTP